MQFLLAIASNLGLPVRATVKPREMRRSLRAWGRAGSPGKHARRLTGWWGVRRHGAAAIKDKRRSLIMHAENRPALSALNLGRLLRVVLPVKRDRSPDNPKLPATTLPACLIASGLALAQCTKVNPGAAGLARLHYGGYSKVRGRL